jgi:hypothetical protein
MNATESTPAPFRLSIRNVGSFEAKLESLNRRARRLGVAEATFKTIGTRQEVAEIFTMESGPMGSCERKKIGQETVLVTEIELSLNVPTVRLDGWTFRAKLTPFADGNIVSGAPGREDEAPLPEHFRTCAIACEHCKTDRRRKEAFVVQHPEQGLRMIGRNCLVDFIGSMDAEKVAKRFEFWAEIYTTFRDYEEGERGAWEGGGVHTYSLTEIIGRALLLDGGAYVSAKKASDDYTGRTVSTGEKVKLTLRDDKFKAEFEAVRDDLEEKAAAMVNHVAARLTGASDYEANLSLIIGAGYCTKQTIGIGASIIAAFNRMEREALEKENFAASEFIGAEGQRLDVAGVVLSTWTVEGDYGVTKKFLVQTAEGNLAVANNLNAEKGDAVAFKATVKRHSEWKGSKRTEFSRPAKVTVTPAAAVAA